FELTFDSAADFAGGQGFEQASGVAEGFDRTHDVTASVLQQGVAVSFDRDEWWGVGGRRRLMLDFCNFGSFRRRGGFGGFRRRGGFRYFRRGGGLRGLGGFVDRGSCGVGRGFHGGFRRPGFFLNAFGGGGLPGVAHALLHFLDPLGDHFGIAHAFDLGGTVGFERDEIGRAHV